MNNTKDGGGDAVRIMFTTSLLLADIVEMLLPYSDADGLQPAQWAAKTSNRELLSDILKAFLSKPYAHHAFTPEEIKGAAKKQPLKEYT